MRKRRWGIRKKGGGGKHKRNKGKCWWLRSTCSVSSCFQERRGEQLRMFHRKVCVCVCGGGGREWVSG